MFGPQYRIAVWPWFCYRSRTVKIDGLTINSRRKWDPKGVCGEVGLAVGIRASSSPLAGRYREQAHCS
jgi:hypothetical protein